MSKHENSSDNIIGTSKQRFYFGVVASGVLTLLAVLVFYTSGDNPSPMTLLAFYILVGLIGGLLFFIVDPLRDQSFKWKGIVNVGGAAAIGVSIMFVASLLTPTSTVTLDTLQQEASKLQDLIDKDPEISITAQVSAAKIVVDVSEYSVRRQELVKDKLTKLSSLDQTPKIFFQPQVFDVLLMDSTLPVLQYDQNIGPNAKLLTPLLYDLRYLKFDNESTDPGWRDFDQVLQNEPDLIIIHASCFLNHTRQPRQLELLDPTNMFHAFLRYMAPKKTKFLVYSRVVQDEKQEAQRLEELDPRLRGRVHVFHARDSFKKGAEIMAFKGKVKEILEIP